LTRRTVGLTAEVLGQIMPVGMLSPTVHPIRGVGSWHGSARLAECAVGHQRVEKFEVWTMRFRASLYAFLLVLVVFSMRAFGQSHSIDKQNINSRLIEVASDDCPSGMSACCYPGEPNNCTCCNSDQSCCYDSGNKTVWCSANGCGNGLRERIDRLDQLQLLHALMVKLTQPLACSR